ncbi:FitA-like ribbon-helix-helix domain-containing protein [Arthrobacter sp. USHLN218]|uniref:FitA-like ribbon-helix-helix domain-containing protein n=1 Tax=Arthrobacter sp. USHLN218 TaxID=3081232 RepID=UPI00301ABEA9
MEALTIPGLEPRIMEGLRILAESHGRTLEAEARAILCQAARGLTEADEFLASMVGEPGLEHSKRTAT